MFSWEVTSLVLQATRLFFIKCRWRRGLTPFLRLRSLFPVIFLLCQAGQRKYWDVSVFYSRAPSFPRRLSNVQAFSKFVQTPYASKRVATTNKPDGHAHACILMNQSSPAFQHELFSTILLVPMQCQHRMHSLHYVLAQSASTLDGHAKSMMPCPYPVVAFPPAWAGYGCHRPSSSPPPCPMKPWPGHGTSFPPYYSRTCISST